MDEVSEETEATFQLLRVPYLHLVSIHSINPSNAAGIAAALQSIHSTLERMNDPELHLTLPLIKYVKHGLDHILSVGHKFIPPNTRFDYVVEPWCHCLEFLLRLPHGYAHLLGRNWMYGKVLFEVLLSVVDGISSNPVPGLQRQHTTGIPPDATKLMKDRMSDETRLGALRCVVLLLPLGPHVPDILGSESHDHEHQEWRTAAPFWEDRTVRSSTDIKATEHLAAPESRKLIGPLIVILLETAANASLLSLRLTALEGLLKLIRALDTTPRAVAAWLPGILAGLAKCILIRGSKEHHMLIMKALDIWAFTVVVALRKDSTNFNEGTPSTDGAATMTGDQFVRMYNEKQRSGLEQEEAHGSSDSIVNGTEAWFKRTFQGLKTLFHQISEIRQHSHWMVRLKFSQFSFQILRECQDAISVYSNDQSDGVAGFLLQTLIACSQDEYDQVSQPSKSFLRRLTSDYQSNALADIAKEIMREKLVALPRVLHGPDESRKQHILKLVQGLTLFLGTRTERVVNYENIWSLHQSWLGLLVIEHLDQHNLDDRIGILGNGFMYMNSPFNKSKKEDQLENVWTKKNEQQQNEGLGLLDRKFAYPRKICQYLKEQTTIYSFFALLRQLGSTTDSSAWSEDLVGRLQQDARAAREGHGWFYSRSASAVVILNHMMLGASDIGVLSLNNDFEETAEKDKKTRSRKMKTSSTSRKPRHRRFRKLARGVLEEYLSLLTEISVLTHDTSRGGPTGRSLRRGVHRDAESQNKESLSDQFVTAEDIEDFVPFLAETQRNAVHANRILKCVLLEGVATCAVILGSTELTMELVGVLYVLLEHLGDQDSALVRETAKVTLEHVAFVCGHDTIGSLIQANYDYVIQQVSQRIAFLSANPKTPQVLWSLIHVVGPPAVSMLEDSVGEIFDALDNWGSQDDEVAEGLLKSLKEIVQVIRLASKGVDYIGPELKPGAGVQQKSGIEVLPHALPSKNVADFAEEYQRLHHGIGISKEDDDDIKKDTIDMTPDQIKSYFLQRETEMKGRKERMLGEEVSLENEDEGTTLADNSELPSFTDRPEQSPKPSKETKPALPSRQQALCLRILDKAGYFLTALSPKMRMLALGAIQASIVVLKDIPQELNPAVFKLWPALVRRILGGSEMELSYVSLEAIEVITVLAENCSDFLSRHFTSDVLPFILRVLWAWTAVPLRDHKSRHRPGALQPLMEQQQGKGENMGSPWPNVDGHRRNTNLHVPKPQQHRGGSRRALTKVYTRESRMQLTTLQSVSRIVSKVRIPVDELWELLLLVRDMVLDHGQLLLWDVRLAAVDVIKSMAIAGHGDAVWVVVCQVVEDLKASNMSLDFPYADNQEDDAYGLFKGVISFMETMAL
ncbi:TEL2-interacting protein 1 [Podila epigama]|nr:TEL2-interacting protein 1 [Podila epigama]